MTLTERMALLEDLLGYHVAIRYDANPDLYCAVEDLRHGLANCDDLAAAVIAEHQRDHGGPLWLCSSSVCRSASLLS